jgi:hypothetical protein
MGGSAGAKQSPVTLKIEVKFRRVGHVCVDNGSRATVPTFVGIALGSGKESDMMTLANDDDSYLGRSWHSNCSACR